jgi:crossover junction endodeoxyribonuclease RuvC
MIVLGIDPGTRHLGWGLVTRVGTRAQHVAHGVIDTDASAPLAERLCQIERELCAVVEAHRPTASAVESLFFAKDAQAAAKLGHARGVALLVLARAGLSIAEYPPARVKRAVVGHGRADKQQVARMVATVLGLDAPPRSDAADAIAVALAHLNAAPFLATVQAAAAIAARIRRPARPRLPAGFRPR